MEASEVDKIARIVNNMDYKEKLEVFTRVFSMGNIMTNDLNDKLVLISLSSLVYKKLKEKDKNLTALDVLKKISGVTEKESIFFNFITALAIIVEDFSAGSEKIDNCGFTNSQDIIKKIKILLNLWLPF